MGRTWAIVSFLCVTASVVVARPTKVALTINNDSDGIRKAVAKALDDSDVELVSAKKTDRAIERLGLDDIASASDAKKLARELDVDTVVRGDFDADARKLKVTIFTHGRKGGTFSVRVGDAKSPKFKKSVRTKVLAKLGASDGAPDGEPDEKPADKPIAKADDKPVESDTKAGTTEPHRPGNKQVAAEDATSKDADEPPGSVHAVAAVPAPPARGANLAAFRFDAGASFTSRSLQIDGSATGTYKSSGAGGRVATELYPMAFSGGGALAGAGVAVEYEQTRSAAAKDRHYAIGARYRVAFGHTATSPTATLGVAYAARTFTLDRSSGMAPVDVPDIDYRMIVPGLGVRIPLGTRIALAAGGDLLLLRSAGGIATQDQYGTAHVIAYEVSAGFDVVVSSHVALRVSGEDTQLDLKFYGNGAMAAPHATDRYIGGAATLAVFY